MGPPTPRYGDRLERRRPLALQAFCSETSVVSAQRSPRPEALRCSSNGKEQIFQGRESPDADFQASSRTHAGPAQGHLAGRDPDGPAVRASLPRACGGAHCLVLRSPRSLTGHRLVSGTPLLSGLSAGAGGSAHGRGEHTRQRPGQASLDRESAFSPASLGRLGGRLRATRRLGRPGKGQAKASRGIRK